MGRICDIWPLRHGDALGMVRDMHDEFFPLPPCLMTCYYVKLSELCLLDGKEINEY